MTMMRTQIGKNCGRGTRDFSTMRSSSSISLSWIIKRRWENQKSSGLWVAFLGGYIGHIYINYQKRKEHWFKVDRMYNEQVKRSEELYEKFLRYINEDYEDPKSSS